MKCKLERIFTIVGTVLIICAIILLAHNTIEDLRASRISNDIVSELRNMQQAIPLVPSYEPGEEDMLAVEIDGYEYIGFIAIPVLELKLPVMSKCDNNRLKKSPCRQSGTTFNNNLIIAGHNYDAHFGRLKNLSYGDSVSFTDMYGVCTTYSVSRIEILKPTQLEALESGDWNMTLYTCTYGGKNRTVVRLLKTSLQ